MTSVAERGQTAATDSLAWFVAMNHAAESETHFRTNGFVTAVFPSSTLPEPAEAEGPDRVDGLDYGELSTADLAMMRHAMRAGAEELDFSEFYLDDGE